MSIAVSLPDGVAVRNFVMSAFLEELGEDSVLLHDFPDDALEWLKPLHNGHVSWRATPPTDEKPLKFVFRQVLAYGHMYEADTLAMRFNRARPMRGSWRTQAAGGVAKRCGQAAAAVGALGLVEKLSYRFLDGTDETAACRKLLQDIDARVLFCANQRAPQIAPLVLAARSLGIPTATFIVSWDNLTSKGRIVAPFDHYMVWGPRMREELLRYYPSIPGENVHVVGSPQFDPYAHPEILTDRASFFAEIGADPERPLICYSGGEPLTNPEDQDHLRVMMELIADGRIRNRPQVLLRPSPADGGERYRPVLDRYPEIIFSLPRWRRLNGNGRSLFSPSPEDIRLLANLTQHVDVNVNCASTMTLDFSFRDKPVVNPAFDLHTPPAYPKPLRDFYYRWEHYEPVIELGAARISASVEEYAEHINLCLEQPAMDREGRRQLVDLQVGAPTGESAGRVAQVLREIAR